MPQHALHVLRKALSGATNASGTSPRSECVWVSGPCQALLAAGGTLVGKTHMDELAYSLNGENFHYGTPVNPACPDRIPGGSSSGSAASHSPSHHPSKCPKP